MFDSFLYGYGLTLALFGILGKMAVKNDSGVKYFFNYNNFLKAFLHAKYHKKVLRDFNKYFDINIDAQKHHDEAKAFLIANENEIYSVGFERWISKYVPIRDNPQINFAIIYSYFLYNYWYHLLYTQVLQEVSSKEFLKNASLYIKANLKPDVRIYTTNFDTLLDTYLFPEHIHGTFALPLNELRDLFIKFDRVKDEHEYSYLLGTNGVEKQNRINLISKLEQKSYDLGFFFQKDLVLGHLLIYGMSFGYNQIMPDDYLEKNPQEKTFHYLRSVDGHILRRIEELFADGKVRKVTISYYTKGDFENIKNIVGATTFKSIVEYKHATEIFNFNSLAL
jgi:hypothetical protein